MSPPPQFDLLPGGSLPSVGTLVAREPRGGVIDQSAVVAAAADVPPLPGTGGANEREAYRRCLIAANRAIDDHVVNETARGALEGTAVVGLFVVGAVFCAEVAVVAGAVALGVMLLGGKR